MRDWRRAMQRTWRKLRRPAMSAAAPSPERAAAGGGLLTRGFSLVETMVVLLVMAILLGAAIPNFVDHQRRNRAESAAENLAARIKLARQKAIARRTQYRLTLDPVNGSYVLERRDPGGVWVNDPPDVFNLPEGLGMDVELGNDAGNLDLVMDPQGLMDIADVPGQIRFRAANDTLTVSVVRTGRIRVTRGS
ncbi:MAG: prepilin-type N-terminal cleavage/methylation domain-containing protein [Candidatus Eisenbacteria bacterium]|nr:prepilin-type N-terminal cleavage/methylation domain-containing protein [Candidatus Eisenbacteria bacterium]